MPNNGYEISNSDDFDYEITIQSHRIVFADSMNVRRAVLLAKDCFIKSFKTLNDSQIIGLINLHFDKIKSYYEKQEKQEKHILA